MKIDINDLSWYKEYQPTKQKTQKKKKAPYFITKIQCFRFLILHQSPFLPNTKEHPIQTVPLQTLLSYPF